jgi:hypothetical protein
MPYEYSVAEADGIIHVTRHQQVRPSPLSLRQLADLHAESRAGARRPVAVVCAAGHSYGAVSPASHGQKA